MTDYYPIAEGEMSPADRKNYRVVPTGEKRQPRADEWYLSDAIPEGSDNHVEGYKAKHDMTAQFRICRLVKGQIVTLWRPLDGSE